MRNDDLLEIFLIVQGFMLAVAIIPFLVGLWRYRRDGRIDRSGTRATGCISRLRSKRRIREIASGPHKRKGQKARHRYTVEYVCHDGIARELIYPDSGYQVYQEGDQLEVAYLRENANIARLEKELYISAYVSFWFAGILVAIPGLIALFFWMIATFA